MPDKQMAIQRAWRRGAGSERPIMVGIAGDSASGKTTLTKGLVDALGRDRITAICVDDYHRYDRVERKGLPFTPLHPACNYVEVMEQHLQLLALGQPVLKPVYNHATGTLDRPVLVEPSAFVIADALHVHAYAERSLTDRVERALWHALQEPEPLPGGLGRIGPEGRSEPLVVVQLLLLYHLFQARGGGEARPPEPALVRPAGHAEGA